MTSDLLLAPQALPFAVAFALILAIAAIEGAAQLLGFQVFGWNTEPDGFDGADAWLGWLHVGKVPLLVLLVMLLTAFALIGYGILAIYWGFFGLYPPVWGTVPLAFFSALPVVRRGGLAIGRLIPRDETSAVLLETLVGRIAIVVNGTARTNYPAQARVRNDAGQSFYVHVEPDEPEAQLRAGESVLLVKQISGSRFQAIANPRPDLL